MVNELDRRQMIGASLVTVAAAGLGVTGASPAAAESAKGQSGCRPEIPTVPGMKGDPKANQFWFQYDEDFLFNPAPEVIAAAEACTPYLGSFEQLVERWMQERKKSDYPRDFRAHVAPVREPLRVISRAQLKIFDKYYRCDPGGMVNALVDCGQGVLYDPRRPEGLKVHMMSSPTGEFPRAWHRWHVVNRAMTVLGIDERRWRAIDPLVGLGWATQWVAQPVVNAYNPRLDRRTIARLKRAWLGRGAEQLDRAFESWPEPRDPFRRPRSR